MYIPPEFMQGVSPFSSFQWSASDTKLCHVLEVELALHISINPARLQKSPWNTLKKCTLKTGSDTIVYWLSRYCFLLGFIMSKKVRGCVLNFQLDYIKAM